MNKQEIFNTVYRHLLKQNKRSEISGKVGCKFRGDDGTSCAAGCLIKDEYYRPEIESAWWILRSAAAQEALILSGISREYFGFIQDCQKIHDWTKPDTWKMELANLANVEGLEVPND